MAGDERVLGEGGAGPLESDQGGPPCGRCGQKQRLEFGQVTYKGTSLSSNSSGLSASDRLAERSRIAGDNRARAVPTPAAWTVKKTEGTVG